MHLSYKNTILNIFLYKGNKKIEDTEIFNKIFRIVVEERSNIEKEIIKNPLFKYSLEPVKYNKDEVDEIVRIMYESSSIAGVGPMASVAGAIAEILCKKCVDLGFEAGIIENGGDIGLFGDREFKIQIYAGKSLFSNKFFIKINPAKITDNVLGICTSSASVGPSISFGDSDATTVIADSPSLADAFATYLGNLVHYDKNDDENNRNNIKEVIEIGKKFNSIKGICIIVKNKIGVWNIDIEKI